MRNKQIVVIVLAVAAMAIGLFLRAARQREATQIVPTPEYEEEVAVTAAPSASPSASPTPRPLTFAEMNEKYGPCVTAPTLMYHHVGPAEAAEAGGYKWMNVVPETFRQQMEYLRARGYTAVTMAQVAEYFDSSAPLPAKPVLITFDDGYEDFASQALPILREYGMSATVFVTTGLMENPNYMSWGQMTDGDLVLYANHTWSHQNMATNREKINSEIATAETQLADHGLGMPKVFAYPYGLTSAGAVAELSARGYRLAFTTESGRILCAKQRLALPRVRVGNGSLASYGL